MNSPAILDSSRSSKSATDLSVEVQQSQLIGALESAMDKVQAENLLRLVADMVESQGGDPVKIVSPVKQSSGQAQEVPGPRKTPGGQKNKGEGRTQTSTEIPVTQNKETGGTKSGIGHTRKTDGKGQQQANVGPAVTKKRTGKKQEGSAPLRERIVALTRPLLQGLTNLAVAWSRQTRAMLRRFRRYQVPTVPQG